MPGPTELFMVCAASIFIPVFVGVGWLIWGIVSPPKKGRKTTGAKESFALSVDQCLEEGIEPSELVSILRERYEEYKK